MTDERWESTNQGYQVIDADTGALICLVKKTGDAETQHARAALIAAAPDMARAIARYLELDSDCDYTEGFPAVCPGIERAGLQYHWCELHDALVKVGKP